MHVDGGPVPTEQDDPGPGQAAPLGKPVLGDSSSPVRAEAHTCLVTQRSSSGLLFIFAKSKPPPGQRGYVPGGRAGDSVTSGLLKYSYCVPQLTKVRGAEGGSP